MNGQMIGHNVALEDAGPDGQSFAIDLVHCDATTTAARGIVRWLPETAGQLGAALSTGGPQAFVSGEPVNVERVVAVEWTDPGGGPMRLQVLDSETTASAGDLIVTTRYQCARGV